MLRLLGGSLLLFSVFPIYRGLDTSGDSFRVASVEIAEMTLEFVWWGSISVLLLSALLAFFFPAGPSAVGRTVEKWLCKPSRGAFAAAMGLSAFLLSFAVAELLFQGLYTNMDEIASAVQARYLAQGSLAGPMLQFPEAFLVTNTLMVEEGWVSQYPPSHLLIMALFFLIELPILTGPFLMGVMAWLLALAYPRLLSGQEGMARVASLLTALCPFLLFLAGGSLSHLTAGAAGALVLYASLRARDGSAAWGLVVGAGVGIMVSARPLVGLVLGTAFPLTLWARAFLRGPEAWAFRRVGTTVLGGIPFAVLLGIYNNILFGSPTRFGYLAAFGRNHQLGFHVDPWGNLYDLEAAVAFTSTDLLAYGVQLLETPLPLTLAVGAVLLVMPFLGKGASTILAWAFLPLVANFFYWFHSSRMMFEAAPAWILLAVVGLSRIISSFLRRGQLSQRVGQWLSWVALTSLVTGMALGIPTRWSTYTWTDETLDRIELPAVPTDEPSLVFVHTSWNERLGSRLQGAGGMRQDSIVSILRRNTNCQLQRFTEAREERARERDSNVALPKVDLEQSAAYPQGLVRASPYPGVTIRTREGEAFPPTCRREMEADRFGNVALAPLLWQGDLPGVPGNGSLFARDLGPGRNQALRDLYPDRTAFVFSPFSQGGPPEIAPYAEAMRVLWGIER